MAALEMLSFIYEEMDVDAIERKFIELVRDIFPVGRVGLFFVKHKRGVLQGKLCSGFDPDTINALEIPVKEEFILTRPLITGFPIWKESAGDDPYARQLGLENFAVIPITNQNHIRCWEAKNCKVIDCPANARNFLRCWLVPGVKCFNGDKMSVDEQQEICKKCHVFTQSKIDSIEGILLIDCRNNDEQFTDDKITLLVGIAYGVGVAINNSKLHKKMVEASIRDELTGLHNRRYFNERLVDELERSRRYQIPISMILVDIDHFKAVNDNYGHPTGDAVLAWLGKTLRNQLRQSDVVARYGGDEFAILLLHSGKQLACELADDIRKHVETMSFKARHGLKLTCSFGVATIGEDANSFEGLISKTDKALYYAKAQGRNKVCSL